jgi:hypothetical protein
LVAIFVFVARPQTLQHDKEYVGLTVHDLLDTSNAFLRDKLRRNTAAMLGQGTSFQQIVVQITPWYVHQLRFFLQGHISSARHKLRNSFDQGWQAEL